MSPPARQCSPFRLPATPNNVTIGEMFYHLMSEHQKFLTKSDLAPPFDKKIDFSPRSDSRPIFASESCFSGSPGGGRPNQRKSIKSIEINKISIKIKINPCPRQWNPPKILKILWKSLYFLQISSKMFFFFLEISENLPGSRESAPRSRRPGSGSLGPAEILRISPPRKIGSVEIFYRQIFFWWDGSFRSR